MCAFAKQVIHVMHMHAFIDACMTCAIDSMHSHDMHVPCHDALACDAIHAMTCMQCIHAIFACANMHVIANMHIVAYHVWTMHGMQIQ